MAAWLAGYASGGSYWNSVGRKLLYLDAGEREADTERPYCLWAVSCSGTFCGLSLWRGDAGVVSGAEFVTVQPSGFTVTFSLQLYRIIHCVREWSMI